MTDQGVLLGEIKVLLGRGEWPPRGPLVSQAARTERRDQMQGCSMTPADQDALQGEGQVLPD